MFRILLVLLILVAGAIGVAYAFGASMIRDGVVTYGPQAVNVPVELDSVSLNPLTGSGSVKGLGLGNPERFGDGNMMKIGEISFDARMSTLLSGHIIVDSLVIDEAFLEGRLKSTKTNFQEFMDKLPEVSSSEPASSAADSTADQITLTIKRLEVRSPRIKVTSEGLIEGEEEVSLESFTLTNLGTDEQGLAPAEIARHIMDTLGPQITTVLANKAVQGKLDDLKDKAEKELEKIGSRLLNSLTKKKKKP